MELTDPDRLVYLLSDLHEDKTDVGRQTILEDDNVVHRLYRTAQVLNVLNAFARLLVQKIDGSGQVFAVGLVPPLSRKRPRVSSSLRIPMSPRP